MSKLNKLASQAKKAKPASFSEDALKNFTQKIEETGVVETVATAKIVLNPANDYRDRDNDESINSLAEDISRQGYSTYMYLKHPASDTYEWFADENGNLQKLVKNGKVYEGNAISAEEIQNWDAIKEKPENK